MRNQVSLTDLRGIGKARAEVFASAGISDVASLLTYFPASFRENRLTLLNDTDPAEGALCRLKVTTVPRVAFFAHGRRALRFVASDASGSCEVVFFYQTYLISRFAVGKEYYFYGRFKLNGTRHVTFSPEFEDADKPLAAITPVYPLVKGLSQKMLTSALREAVLLADTVLEENLEPCLVEKLGLLPRAEAARKLHFPKTMEEAQKARERFAFEELYFFRLDLLLLQRKRGIPSVCGMHAVNMAPFFAALGFTPTTAQNRAIAEISADLIGDGHGKKIPAMHRLLQGDVGSGKTAVAAASLYLTMQNGKKCALMAPTELLAEQHAKKLAPVFRTFGF
ncbi:MAG: DEAD/DEAH box helicase, partial [Clostridia bacterium]|nr:DEAD/DEAH box helicase [Clostridia bacterium]